MKLKRGAICSQPQLVDKADRPDSNRSDADPDAKRRTDPNDYPRNARDDYSEGYKNREQCVDHDLSSSNARQLVCRANIQGVQTKAARLSFIPRQLGFG